MRSLWVKLTGAFLLIILLFGVINLVLINRMTKVQFSAYTSTAGKALANNLAPTFLQFYEDNGSWENVESVSILSNVQPGMPMMGNMMQGGGMNSDSSLSMWEMMGIQIVLVDNRNEVVYNSLGDQNSIQITEEELNDGVNLNFKNESVGTLLAFESAFASNSASLEFLNAMSVSVWQSILIGFVIAFVLGSVLFRQITSPVFSVIKAAKEIASGNLEQRVVEKGNDEVSQLASTFNQMADALEHDRTLRHNMTADIAHELRTPISIIQGNLEAMLDGVLPTSSEEISSLHNETVLLTRLVSDLRLLSLAETGNLQLQYSNVDLASLIQQKVSSFSSLAQTKNISIEFHAEEGIPALNLDIDRMSQVIQNLLDNAVRYTPDGGKVVVEVFKSQKAVYLDFIDTGKGISEEDIEFIFDRFYRAEKSRNRASGGSGIGLAIVRQLVIAQGGEISVESPVFADDDGNSFGTRFRIIFPDE